MPKVYKTVRVAQETKKFINDLIIKFEYQLKSDKESLVIKYEDILRKNPDFNGYSPTLSVTVSSGSILEAAYNYCNSLKLSSTDWLSMDEEIKDEAKTIGNLDVGSITPRFLIDTEILAGLEELQWKLKPDNMQRNLQLNYIIKLVIYRFYKKEILKKE